uniref:Uncharacterized protein n=1 Tax=Anguilla anguilla TaxID=7936 RepID=A0A0E9WR59_ANGAN
MQYVLQQMEHMRFGVSHWRCSLASFHSAQLYEVIPSHAEAALSAAILLQISFTWNIILKLRVWPLLNTATELKT